MESVEYTFKEMDMVTQVQILDEAVYISHSAKTLTNCMNPSILSLTIEIVGQNGLFNLCITTGLEEGKLEFKPVKLHTKIDCGGVE